MCDRLVASHIHHFRRWSNFYNKADPFFVRTRPCFRVTLCNSLLLTHLSLIKSHSIRSHPSHTYPNPNLNLTFPYSNSAPLRTTSSDFSPEIFIMVSIMVYEKRFYRTRHNYHRGPFWLFLFCRFHCKHRAERLIISQACYSGLHQIRLFNYRFSLYSWIYFLFQFRSLALWVNSSIAFWHSFALTGKSNKIEF